MTSMEPKVPWQDFQEARWPWWFGVLIVWCTLASLPLLAQTNPTRTRSPHGDLDIPCENCHTSIGWKPIRARPEFNHDTTTRFPLRGMHENVACTRCHVQMEFRNVGSNCADCHADLHRSQFGDRCETCHTVRGWTAAVQSFREHQNRFILLGAHAAVQCETCHVGAAQGTYVGLDTQCVSCHIQDYRDASTLDHSAARFPTDCAQCHTADRWFGAKFDHVRLTNFPLQGAHARATCSSCHAGGQFAGTPTDCYGCHVRDYEGAANPNHVAGGFPRSCSNCHSSVNWSGATFDHTLTRFPLTGAHVQTQCVQCHANNQFTGTSTECVSCHLADFNATTNPNHVASGFPQTCSSCHNTSQWQGAQFDHSQSRFPLTGAHVQTQCAQCHVNNQFTGVPTACVSCHLADFNATTNPNHVASGLSQNCTSCHTTAQWAGARFDHSQSRFPLTGAHVQTQCAQCHVNNQFTGTPTTCVSCHLADFNATTNPNHVASGFPQNCTSCHTTAQWAGARFDHSQSRFPLTGAHVQTQCAQCHVNNQFTGTPTGCDSCHLDEFTRTANPNHVAAGFPQDCTLCHTTAQWGGALFDHSTTDFPLTGAHTTQQCASCHLNGVFSGLSSSCGSCHLDDFNRATNPNHAAVGFPQDCQLCHGTTQWQGATFNHSLTQFPLTGSHVTTQCANCHLNNRFAGTPTNCYDCHRTEYTTVTDPSHLAAGFPTTCASCHNTTRWSGATFTHNFPIYSGAHQDKWDTCSTCHTNPTNYAVFSCTTCHEHEQTRMNEKHREVRNYVYSSLSCYSCHPQGRH